MNIPDTLYIVIGDFGPLGLGSPDFLDDLSDAADQLAETERLTGRDGQVLEINTLTGTNKFITAKCVAILRDRERARYGEVA